jgi:hypothetical protein
VDFVCWFGNIPARLTARKSVRLTSPVSMHRKVTGKSPDNSSSSRAQKLAFWIVESDRVRPESAWKKGGSVKTSILGTLPKMRHQSSAFHVPFTRFLRVLPVYHICSLTINMFQFLLSFLSICYYHQRRQLADPVHFI